MIRLLVRGALTSDPVRRTTVKGSAYATFQLRAQAAADAVLVSCCVFGPEGAAEVLRLRKGESVSVTGRGEMNSWIGRNGAENHGLKCTVDRVLSMAKRKRLPVADAATMPAPRAEDDGGSFEDMEDDIPWPRVCQNSAKMRALAILGFLAVVDCSCEP